MNRETRVQKYAKLREDIDNIDETILGNIQKKKFDVVKESMKHGTQSKEKSNINTSNLSIEDILEGHSKYVDLENYQIDKHKSKPKTKLFILLGVVFVVVIVLVMIALFRR
ncbi:MAG: hypothetical protein J1F31_00505 [Erysipelotrichales bacterium]|nr:hypothetical protein [Erysipelotrichales bacterium]